MPRCRHCGWALYSVTLADATKLWHDNVHDDIRCLVNPTGLHEPHPYLVTWVPKTAVSGRG